ncbi:helix-turn-helix domain-containing protein [Streptomyces sp. GD-15H]|uniref:helix-turn-helix domain-containing protein n=1 Tax=Streptomyces sp. GD-15H TaxID=3129112 RepID=UPI0038732FE3
MSESAQSRRPGRPPQVSATTIETVALRLFVDQGFAATTVSDIARRCHVSRTTVFRYFPTKADLVWPASTRTSHSCGRSCGACPSCSRQ